jgi:hypothetical protein
VPGADPSDLAAAALSCLVVGIIAAQPRSVLSAAAQSATCSAAAEPANVSSQEVLLPPGHAAALVATAARHLPFFCTLAPLATAESLAVLGPLCGTAADGVAQVAMSDALLELACSAASEASAALARNRALLLLSLLPPFFEAVQPRFCLETAQRPTAPCLLSHTQAPLPNT